MNIDERTNTNYLYFLLCKECFWCASAVNLRESNRIINCPVCNDANVKLMPILIMKLIELIIVRKVDLQPNLELNTHTRICLWWSKNKVYWETKLNFESHITALFAFAIELAICSVGLLIYLRLVKEEEDHLYEDKTKSNQKWL